MENFIDNMQKHENYKEQMVRLKKAMASKFYLEAIFIEYAVIEDRTEAILIHSGVFNPKRHGTITAKISRIKELCRRKDAVIRKYISDELLARIEAWKEKRNALIHALLKQRLSTEMLEECAVEGEELAKILRNKVTLYKRQLEKGNR